MTRPLQEVRSEIMPGSSDADLSLKGATAATIQGNLSNVLFVTFLGGLTGIVVACLLASTVFKYTPETVQEYVSRTNGTCPGECLTNPNCSAPTVMSHLVYYITIGALAGTSLVLGLFTAYVTLTQIRFMISNYKNARQLALFKTKKDVKSVEKAILKETGGARTTTPRYSRFGNYDDE